jgi:hypothetical protein
MQAWRAEPASVTRGTAMHSEDERAVGSLAHGGSDAGPYRLAPAAAQHALAAALDRLLDEGITDYSARTRASRRRMAALYVGFVHAEAVLRAIGGPPMLPPATAVAELAAVLRHLLHWAESHGAEDPSAGTRDALGGVRRALWEVTGSDAARHEPLLLDCERCGRPGAELPSAARGDAACGACSASARRRLRAG